MHKVTSRSSISEKNRSLSDASISKISDNKLSMDLEDWRRAISTPTKYRVGSASFHLHLRQILQFAVLLLCSLFIIVLVFNGRGVPTVSHIITDNNRNPEVTEHILYKERYPLTPPIRSPNSIKYRIAVITDLDHDSKMKNKKDLWQSFYLKGYLTVYQNKSIFVQWDNEKIVLYSPTASGGRGMELSELVVFDGKIITVDDRTGIVYRINGKDVIPWLILSDGNGNVSKGFKSEWATVKDKHLYIGGLGKEWTSETGEVVNTNPQYVKRISPTGSVEHLDWHTHYNAMKDKAGFLSPGYMVHESAAWSDVHKKWFFLPRRASKEKYDDKLDERRATNIMITCDDNFENIEWKRFGPESTTHGFSSFKFLPGSADMTIIALKSEEDNGKTASYIMVLDLDGNVIMKETLIGNYKYEGIEFI